MNNNFLKTWVYIILSLHFFSLIPKAYDSLCNKCITHFFLLLRLGTSPFLFRVFKKAAIGIISNYSLQCPSGCNVLCDIMCTGGLSGLNVELALGTCICNGLCSMTFSSYRNLGSMWVYFSFIVTCRLSLIVIKHVSHVSSVSFL